MTTSQDKLGRFAGQILGGDPLPKLIAGMRDLRDEAFSSREVLSFLENLRANCPDDEKEDILLELMDYAAGFCSEDQRIWKS